PPGGKLDRGEGHEGGQGYGKVLEVLGRTPVSSESRRRCARPPSGAAGRQSPSCRRSPINPTAPPSTSLFAITVSPVTANHANGATTHTFWSGSKKSATRRRHHQHGRNANAPKSGASCPTCVWSLGRLLLRHLRLYGFGRADGDLARLGRFRNLVNQIDMEHAIVELGAGHLHVVSEAKAPLKRAARDAAVQVAVAVLLLLFLLRLARHQERVLVNSDIELGRREPGHGHCQPVGVFTGLLDVERRVAEGCAVDAACRIDQAKSFKQIYENRLRP